MSNKHELQLRALMEALPFASWFKDDKGNFEQVNELLLALLGKEATEVIGKASKEVQSGEDAVGHEEAEKEVLKSGKIRGIHANGS
jgi:PAS domain S-box-containing protein